MACRRHIVLALLVALTGAMGCLHSGQRDRAFSHDWLRQHQKDSEMEAREASVRAKSDWVLIRGEKDTPLTAVVTEVKGNPRVRIGGETGLSGDVSVRSGDPEVRVKYRVRWSTPRPKREIPSDKQK